MVVIVVVPGAQLEDVGKGGEEEQKHLQHQLLCRSVADEERQQPEELNFDQLDDEDDRQESQQQLVLKYFLCKNVRNHRLIDGPLCLRIFFDCWWFTPTAATYLSSSE